MKKLCLSLFVLVFATASHAADLSDEFKQKYKALEPGVSTSVRSDYLFEQISLGSEYTVMLLDMINDRNTDMADKMDSLIEKLDILIEQNRHLIDILSSDKQKKIDDTVQ